MHSLIPAPGCKDKALALRSAPMGYDQVAYLDVDQEDVSLYIAEHGLDPSDWDDMRRIGAEFGGQALPGRSREFGWMYEHNESCDLHEVWCTYGSNFIRDDDRFRNRRFQRALCKSLGKAEDAFPSCLEFICHSLQTRDDALEIAEALGEFFADDRDLAHFADWLRDTATCCSTYELSF